MAIENSKTFTYHVLRYSADIVRDEWLNIGILLFDPSTGDRRLRLIEEEAEFARVRRLQPAADEDMLRGLRDHLDERFDSSFKELHSGAPLSSAGSDLQQLIGKWGGMLSMGLQLSPQKGLHAQDLDEELERLYGEHVALQRSATRAGAPGSRATIRKYCSQIWHQAQLWNRIEKSARAAQYTFPGDPMRIDYSYRRSGTRGFVQTLSVSRAPMACKEYAYTAQYIAPRAAFKSEFAAITDVPLDSGNLRHCFVRDTLRDGGIEPIPMEGFALWVAKLKPTLQ